MKLKNAFMLTLMLFTVLSLCSCDKTYIYEDYYYPENGNNGNNNGGNNGGNDNGNNDGGNDNGGNDNGGNGGGSDTGGDNGNGGNDETIEFKNVYLNSEFTQEIWTYAEGKEHYLILGVKSQSNRFVIINLRDDNYHNSNPSTWIEDLLDLASTGYQIDLLNQTSGYIFSKEVFPCIYQACFYWRSEAQDDKAEALISKYAKKDPYIVTNARWYNADIKYQFINEKAIKVRNFFNKPYIIRLVPEV